MTKIKKTIENRKVLRAHAREALAKYSPAMTWLLKDNKGNLWEKAEAGGQGLYRGQDEVIAVTGDCYKACGRGVAIDAHTGAPYQTQREYLQDLLGQEEYARIFSLA